MTADDRTPVGPTICRNSLIINTGTNFEVLVLLDGEAMCPLPDEQQNQNRLLVIRQIDNFSQGAVTGGGGGN